MDPHRKLTCSTVERHVKGTRDGEAKGILIESLGLRAREVISLVGAGGKTTLMFRLAKELFHCRKRVVTTTTTRILEPSSEETPCLFVDSRDEKVKEFVLCNLGKYSHITIAKERLGAGKLKGVSPDLIVDLGGSPGIDYMIIEADGAARRPIKAPREGEPVIPSNTTLVVAILGMDGLGKELKEENVFQPERVSRMTGIPVGAEITAEAMATLVTHPEGLFKGAPASSRVVAFLNKVDVLGGMEKAKGVAQKILERRNRQIERVVLGQLRTEPPVTEVIFP